MWPHVLAVGAILVLGMVAAPGAVAQTGNVRLVIIHDPMPDGFTFVGNPNQFGYILLIGEKPTVHKDGKIVITQNGVKLYETGGTSAAHDYDAFNSFLYTFSAAGPYTIHAEVPSGGVTYTADFNGTVVRPTEYLKADLQVGKPSTASITAMAGSLVDFEYQLVDAAGTRIDHTDAYFEVRRSSDNWLLFRVHTHTHDEAQAVSYAFAQAGDYTVRILGFNAYPSPDGPMFLPVVKTIAVKVSAAPPSAPVTEKGVVEFVAKGTTVPDYQLLTTRDPADGTRSQVGTFGNVRLNALVYDPKAQASVQHVNYHAVLKGPSGKILFASNSLHEYDGNLEVVTQNAFPGDYVLSVAVQRGNFTKKVDIPFTVIPPAAPLGTGGPGVIKATGLGKLVSGEPQHLEFVALNPVGSVVGTPVQPPGGAPNPTVLSHSEIEVQFNQASATGPPLLVNKLHTHGDGKFAIDVTFPSAGTYYLVLDGETLDGEPTPYYYYDTIGGVPLVKLTVADGVALPEVLPIGAPLAAKDTGASLPGPGLLAVLFAALGLALLRRRYD